MALLLDTHVWLWSQARPQELGKLTKDALVDPLQALYLSPISTLELARLVEAGRVELSDSVMAWVSATTDLLGLQTVDISHTIAAGAYQLPGTFHRDPADRVLVATAREYGLTLLTADERILDYPHAKTQNART